MIIPALQIVQAAPTVMPDAGPLLVAAVDKALAFDVAFGDQRADTLDQERRRTRDVLEGMSAASTATLSPIHKR